MGLYEFQPNAALLESDAALGYLLATLGPGEYSRIAISPSEVTSHYSI